MNRLWMLSNVVYEWMQWIMYEFNFYEKSAKIFPCTENCVMKILFAKMSKLLRILCCISTKTHFSFWKLIKKSVSVGDDTQPREGKREFVFRSIEISQKRRIASANSIFMLHFDAIKTPDCHWECIMYEEKFLRSKCVWGIWAYLFILPFLRDTYFYGTPEIFRYKNKYT